jgi:hypothetical protein
MGGGSGDVFSCPMKERAVKRFIDMLFLNGNGDVTMS